MWIHLIEVKDLFLSSLHDWFDAQRKQAKLLIERNQIRFLKILKALVFIKFERFHYSYQHFWLVN